MENQDPAGTTPSGNYDPYSTLKAMTQERPDKYFWFVLGMRLFALLTPEKRGKALPVIYGPLRTIDNIIDGTSPLPEESDSPEGFAQKYLYLMRNHLDPLVDLDEQHLSDLEIALIRGIRYGEQLGCDFKAETKTVLESMLFDAKRRGKYEIHPEAELDHHYFLLDIFGVGRAFLKLTGEFVEDKHEEKVLGIKVDALTPLGRAVRLYYDLRDLDEDTEVSKYFNFSLEDCIRYNITTKDIREITMIATLYYDTVKEIRGNQNRPSNIVISLVEMINPYSFAERRERKRTLKLLEEEFLRSLPKSFRKMYVDKARQALNLLEEHREMMNGNRTEVPEELANTKEGIKAKGLEESRYAISRRSFRLRTRMAFYLGFERPTRKYCLKIINLLNKDL